MSDESLYVNPFGFSEEEQLRGLVDQLDAYIAQYHGGSVRFESYKDGLLRISMGGACEGCPLQPATVHGWVEGTVRQFFPDVTCKVICCGEET